jgi:hypothetical protein
MKSKTTTVRHKSADNQRDEKTPRRRHAAGKINEKVSVREKLISEGHEDFFNYLDWLGLAKKPDLLILTSSHHYYFEIEDLKNIKVVLNLKKLNTIRNPKDFLREIFHVLPHKCNFIGNFTDNRKHNIFVSGKKSENLKEEQSTDSELDTGLWNSFLKMIYDIIDSKTNRYMSERSVRSLLEETGFKVLDITEFNGLTYFCTQKDKSSVE